MFYQKLQECVFCQMAGTHVSKFSSVLKMSCKMDENVENFKCEDKIEYQILNNIGYLSITRIKELTNGGKWVCGAI